MTKYYIGVVSKSHVDRGVASGIAQLCHGKQAPLARMQKGDVLIYYSPKTDMSEGTPYQKFTAIGRVRTGDVYQFDMGNGFVPYRMDIDYAPCKEACIHELKDQFDFIENPKYWGYKFRFGHFEVSEHDFNIIAKAMEAQV
ncbi:MAG: hypothetical protein S4CHLAM37_16010 [Chlamydiia bacterium]|nr:hypothetical protein [Chlamydiia bacterium]